VLDTKEIGMRLPMVGLALILAAACGAAESDQPLTEGARDSAIAESPLPGAGGVKGALSAADSAAARRALEDSIQATPDP